MDDELTRALVTLFPGRSLDDINLLHQKLYTNLGVQTPEELSVLDPDDFKVAGLSIVETRIIQNYLQTKVYLTQY